MPKKDATRSLSLTSQDSSSGVILADMVADVPVQEPTHHSVDKVRQEIASKASYGTNKAFDGQPATNGTVAVIDVEPTETTNKEQPRPQNGTDIAKGVILNAYLDQGLKNGGGKSVELQMAPTQGAEKAEKGGAPKGISFQDMTLGRKVAFGFSFIPSIMFVLCFAVILPCQKRAPCVEVTWSHQLNDTTITSPLIAPKGVVYSFEGPGRGLTSLDPDTGKIAWNVDLDFEPQLVDCSHFTSPDRESCLVLEHQGAYQLFSADDGARIIRAEFQTSQPSSHVVVLPDCKKDRLSSFALSFPPDQLKVVEGGNAIRTLPVRSCESPPLHLTAWPRTNGTDLVMLCRKERDDILISMTQEMWCESELSDNTEPKILFTAKAGSLLKSILLPTPLGLLVWSDDEVHLIDSNGNKNWTMSTQPHASENRFLFSGKFRDAGMQIAMFSKEESTGFRASLLNTQTGETEWNTTLLDVAVSDVIQIHGENKDFVLLNSKKTVRQPAKQAVAQLSEVPTTILSLLADEKAEVGGANSSGSSLSYKHEISFLEMGGSLHSVHEEQIDESTPYEMRVSALSPKADGLDLLLMKASSGGNGKTSSISKMRVRNWDITLKESKQCAMN